MFSDADLDGDGSISFEEWTVLHGQQFNLMSLQEVDAEGTTSEPAATEDEKAAESPVEQAEEEF